MERRDLCYIELFIKIWKPIYNKRTSVAVSAAGQIRYYSLTPNITSTYVITSTNNTGDPYGYLFAANGMPLTYNDDGNDSLNFRIEYKLTAGTLYVIGAKVYSSTSTGQYMLTITPPSGSLGVREYTYDASGNRTKLKETKNGSVTETTYTYDKNDRLLTEKTGAQTVTYSYDSNGNLIKKSDGTEQTFDALNRMTSYKKGGITTAYTYYPNDMRRGKGSTTQVWIGDEIALDLSGNTTVSSYIHGQKLIQSGYGWYLYNAHGDVTALTNASGSITRNYDYDPYGVQYSSIDSADSNPYRYCGEYYDKESGYTYLRARYYDPAIGRFVSEDSALDGWNWYVYCGNDPIMHIDPSGNCYVDKKTKSGVYIGTYWMQASVPGVRDFCNKCKNYKYLVTENQLRCMGWSTSNMKINDLNKALRKYGITNIESMRHFISQASHESGCGRSTKENGDGKKYEGKKDLGNTQKGDGPKYKGAGYIQVTGRYNYQQFANSIGDQKVMNGVDYVSKNYAWAASAYWWKVNGMNTLCARGATVEAVTKKVNGKQMLALAERKKYYEKAKLFIR